MNVNTLCNDLISKLENNNIDIKNNKEVINIIYQYTTNVYLQGVQKGKSKHTDDIYKQRNTQNISSIIHI